MQPSVHGRQCYGCPCHFRSWRHIAFIVLEIRPLVLQGLLRVKYFQHNPSSFRYFLGPSNILSSDWMILSAYLLLGSSWMSFLTGCFVVCNAHGPGELLEYDAAPGGSLSVAPNFGHILVWGDLPCVITVSAATHHAKKNQQAQQET